MSGVASFLAGGAWSPAMANQPQLHRDSNFTLCLQSCSSPPLRQQSRGEFQFEVSIRGPLSSCSGNPLQG